jgi:hypothetical protein
MFIGVRPQHTGGMDPGLRAIRQPEECEETLGDERELDDASSVRDLEPLEQVDPSTRGRSLEDDDIIPKIKIHVALRWAPC